MRLSLAVCALALTTLVVSCGDNISNRLACTAAVDCDDGDACTTDQCADGTCQHGDVEVDDANACTVDSCDPASGVAHTAVGTDDSDACTVDSCDPATGVHHTPIAIDDSNACTTDTCDPLTGAAHTPISTDDHDTCTTDSCDPVTGVAHTPVATDDSNACTTDTCDPVTGVAHSPVVTDDNDACTTDTCDPVTGIAHTPVVTDDNDACTTDTCDALTGVHHTPVATDDSNACTTDTCDPVTGVAHAPVVADDNSVCTSDSCDPVTGVHHTPVATDDSNACTTDTCDPVTGVAHTPVATDDSNACTTDTCDPVTGVAHAPVATDDSNACTTDACDPTTGVVSHVAVATNDGNACTTDSCDPVTGVAHVAVATDDNNACTADVCDPATGAITHAPTSTDDAIACTVDACDPATGVTHTARDSLCASGQVCGVTGCVAAGATDQDGRIVFTEVLPVTGASPANAGELIELVNTSGVAIDLRGFLLQNAAGQQATIRAAADPNDTGFVVMIPPGGQIYGIANPTDPLTIPLDATFVYGSPGTAFEIADGGDTLSLYASDTGSLEDALPMTAIHTNPTTAMTASEFAALPGVTSQLDPTKETAAQNDDPLSWCVTFYPASGPRSVVSDTAGMANGSCAVAVINEVLIDATGADDGVTFVEIAGPGGAVIGGAKLEDIEGTGSSAGNRNTDGDFGPGETDGEVTIPAGTRIPVDGILLVCDGTTAGITSVPNASQADVIVRDMDLENGGGDAVQLVSSSGTLLDAVGYASVTTTALDRTTTIFNGLSMFEGTTAVYPATASSLARSAASLDTNNNRTDFTADATPTPGIANN